MIRPPPRSIRTDSLFPVPTRFRSPRADYVRQSSLPPIVHHRREVAVHHFRCGSKFDVTHIGGVDISERPDDGSITAPVFEVLIGIFATMIEVEIELRNIRGDGFGSWHRITGDRKSTRLNSSH